MPDARCGTVAGWWAHRAAIRRLTVEYGQRYRQILAEEKARIFAGARNPADTPGLADTGAPGRGNHQGDTR